MTTPLLASPSRRPRRLAALGPARWWPGRPVAVRIGAWIWLLGWFPASRIVLPLKNVLAADRYLLFASLGISLALAAGVVAVRKLAVHVADDHQPCNLHGGNFSMPPCCFPDPK